MKIFELPAGDENKDQSGNIDAYLSSVNSVSFLLFLFSTFHEVRNPGGQSKVVWIISSFLLLLLLSLNASIVLPRWSSSTAAAAVDTIVTRRQLWGTVSGTGPGQ